MLQPSCTASAGNNDEKRLLILEMVEKTDVFMFFWIVKFMRVNRIASGSRSQGTLPVVMTKRGDASPERRQFTVDSSWVGSGLGSNSLPESWRSQ